jgi:DNA-binding XRE family transcriptional regulator
MPNVLGPLLDEVRATLGLNQLEFGELIGASKRTVQRLEAGSSALSRDSAARAARALYPRDPELAARVASHCGATLIELGIVAVPSRPVVSAGATDSVLCAAADILDLSPRAVRPALLAALTRARDLNLDADALIDALSKTA